LLLPFSRQPLPGYSRDRWRTDPDLTHSPQHHPAMNRLTAAPSPLAAVAAVARIERPVVRQGDALVPPQCLLAPQHYERNYAYPLLVWLHSGGGDENEVRTIMPHVSLRNYVALGIRGPIRQRHGYAWPQSTEGIASAEQLILGAVCRARSRYNIHAGRIFIAGYEAAGTMALRMALRNPERFEGAASINGAFPEGDAPLARLHASRGLKLLIAHCRDSQSYPIDRVCRELTLFHTAGMAIHLRQYPCEDELTTQMLHDLDSWLMEQITGMTSEPAESPVVPAEWN
jgi:phospholipase/carboxylesterase